MREIVYPQEQTNDLCLCPLNLLDVNCLNLVNKTFLQCVAPNLKESFFLLEILQLKNSVDIFFQRVSLHN